MLEENKSEQSPQKKLSKKLPWLGIGIGFSTIAVIVLFGLFYYVTLRGAELNQQLSREVSHLQIQLDETQVNLEALKKTSAESSDNFKQMITALQQTLSSNPNTWRVMEGQFYVNLATTELHYENNIAAAIQLLQLADQTLKELSQPGLDNIRHALAQDMAALEAMPALDTVGIYMRLSVLNDQINQLPLLNQSTDNTQKDNAQDTKESWWKKGLQESLHLLGKIVVIRYNSETSPVLVTPDQRAFLFENLHAQMEKAMWALLHHQQDVYHASLEQVGKSINQFFTPNAPLTVSVQANLNQLQQINVNPAMPTLNASTQAFHDYLAEGGKS